MTIRWDTKAPPAVSPGRRLISLGALLLLSLGFLTQSQWASAADRAELPVKDLKALSLEELFNVEVTSVSKKPEALSKTAAAAHVVTADDITRLGALSLPQSLR